jgi:hypothetical protein
MKSNKQSEEEREVLIAFGQLFPTISPPHDPGEQLHTILKSGKIHQLGSALRRSLIETALEGELKLPSNLASEARALAAEVHGSYPSTPPAL